MSDTPTPNDDERAGIAWWNGLSETARSFWLHRVAAAGGPTVNPSAADAWEAWKLLKDDLDRLDRMILTLAALPDDTMVPSLLLELP